LNLKPYRYTRDNFHIADCDTEQGDEFGTKEESIQRLNDNLEKMAVYQDKLYSEGREGILIVIQAMDAAGKDGAIKHIFTIFNPAGVNVYSFKQPSQEELAHDYLWRAMKNLPERGRIAIFNRSYYEDVLVGKVHKLYENQKMPKRCENGDVIKRRYEEIRNFEKYIYNNGITVLKFFLNVSVQEQKERFLERIDDESKNWKFSHADIEERAYWDDYMKAYEEAINQTATQEVPWYVIPADKKWFAHCLISEIVCAAMKEIDPHYPELPQESKNTLLECRKAIMEEKVPSSETLSVETE